MTQEVYILSAARTPIGSFGGSLAGLSATELGSIAIKGAVDKSGLVPMDVQQVLMGNVVSANLGQAPARQAALGAGIFPGASCTTINKVCASGMKSVMLAAQSIMLGYADVIVAGGMESMSNIPYYLPKARRGHGYGHGQIVDGLLHDGLWEVYHGFPMGSCADHTAEKMSISREEQDEYAIQSYKRAAHAVEKGYFKNEIVPVTIPQKKAEPMVMDTDEEYTKVNFDKIPTLPPAFSKEGTVTAANASTISDGAAALVLAGAVKVIASGLKPIAKIRGFADTAQEPLWFTTAPSLAIPKAMKKARVDRFDVSCYEINEAFSVVPIANSRELSLCSDRVNIFGGAVALGHPLGCSGARIITTLISVLTHERSDIGVASICNGGGGASAIVIEKL